MPHTSYLQPHTSYPAPKAMILSAGLGSRLKPWTNHHPKALAIVNGKPLLQRNIEYLQQFGIKEVILNVHHFAEQIREAVDLNKGWGSDISISDETDMVLETGGGLIKAAWFFDKGDFVLMNTDVLTDMDLGAMISFHKSHESLSTLAVTERVTSRYFLFDEDDNLFGWRNVKSGEEKLVRTQDKMHPKAFSGIHVISPSIFNQITLQGKFSMVELYLQLAKTNQIKGFDHSHSKFIDVGKPESILQAEQLFR
ncbi:MAG: nucleotidyltransferase family protein [Chitinophagaceae bacterium]